MASSSRPGVLTPLQRDLLQPMAGVSGVYLSGGAALGGFHLGHRRSRDLDWFTPDRGRLDELQARVLAHCEARGHRVGVEQAWPGFRRLAVSGLGEETLVDLVHEPVPQVVPVEAKPLVDGVRVDALEDLAANKLCAVLGRGETKDLVDLFFLARSGRDPLDALDAARARDGGMDPAALAWVLRGVSTDPGGLSLCAPLDSAALRRFRDDLVARLARRAHPEG